MKDKILKQDDYGRGITYYKDKIVFIEDGLVGDIVEYSIIKETSKYFIGRIDKILEKSPYRIIPKCKYNNICGGCQLGHYSYEYENKFKEDKVKNLVNKFNIETKVLPIIYDNEFAYRNKIILHGNNNGFGLYKKNSHDIVNIDKCLLLDNKINNLFLNLKTNFKTCTIRCSNSLDNRLISYDNSNKEYIKTDISSKKYYISGESFFQVNKFITSKMYDLIKEETTKINPNKILDLYSGCGSIGIYLDKDNVTCIESNISSHNDAIKNKKLNNSKVNLICGKVEDYIEDFSDIDLIIVDPPRSGLSKKVIDNLFRISPKNIIYMSCNIITLVRDLKLLEDKYNISYIQPFNNFPRTYHVETVALLSRIDVDKHISVEIELDELDLTSAWSTRN